MGQKPTKEPDERNKNKKQGWGKGVGRKKSKIHKMIILLCIITNIRN